MKKWLLCSAMVLTVLIAKSQQAAPAAPAIYDPAANAEKDLEKAIAEAARTNKHVFVQMGGNWCIWCLRFNKFVTEDKQLDSLVKANYVVYHMNYSKENKNEKLLAKYGYPQRFGFPVFVILDAKGNRLNTQNSAYLEEDKSYSRAKVMEFFKHWTPTALRADQYKNY